mmetsp:Transcript_43173/g.137295  ORF Transcript_43173/g.137295 Transcript_43173/m.137295 type:complete len:262 (-) Transcript_43173:145-930(-)
MRQWSCSGVRRTRVVTRAATPTLPVLWQSTRSKMRNNQAASKSCSGVLPPTSVLSMRSATKLLTTWVNTARSTATSRPWEQSSRRSSASQNSRQKATVSFRWKRSALRAAVTGSACTRRLRTPRACTCTRACLTLKPSIRCFNLRMVFAMIVIFSSSNEIARSPPAAFSKIARPTRWSIWRWIVRSISLNSMKFMELSPLPSRARKAFWMLPCRLNSRSLISYQRRSSFSGSLRFSGFLNSSLNSAPTRRSSCRCWLRSLS